MDLNQRDPEDPLGEEVRFHATGLRKISDIGQRALSCSLISLSDPTSRPTKKRGMTIHRAAWVRGFMIRADSAGLRRDKSADIPSL